MCKREASMITVDINDLRDLVREAGDEPVLTLYLATDPADPANHRDAGTRSWEVELRSDLHRIGLAVKVDERFAARFEGARSAVEEWLTLHQPNSRTLVLVAGPDSVIDIELPVALPQSASFGPPALAALARALSEHRLYCMVLVDGETARLAEAAMGFVDDRALLQLDTRWGEPWPTRSEAKLRYDHRRLEYQARHQREVANRIDQLLVDQPHIDRLVLGGNETEAHGVARALGQQATRALVGIVPAPVASTEAELLQRIAPVAEQVEMDADLAVVSGLKAATGSGRAVFGRQAVADALAAGVVQELVLSSHLPGEDALEAIVAQALAAGAEVTVVHTDAATELDGTDGVAAKLYYAAVVVP